MPILTPPAVRDPFRLGALRRTRLLDTPPEAAFDRITRLAGQLLRAPVAAVTLVDQERLFVKSGIGLPEPLASERQGPLARSYCQHVVGSGEPLVMDDVRSHPLGCALVPAERGIASYLGVPLATADGHVLGSLCVADQVPRVWTPEQVATLQDLTASVMAEIQLRQLAGERGGAGEEGAMPGEAHFRTLVERSSDLLLILTAHGHIRYHSPSVQRVMGWDPACLMGGSTYEFIHPDDCARAREAFTRLARSKGSSAELEYRFRCADGGWRVLSSHATNLLHHPDVRGILVNSRDVTARHEAEAALMAGEVRLQRQNLALVELAREQSRPGGSWEESVRRITEAAARTLDVGRIGVWLFDPERRRLECVDRFDTASGRHTIGDEVEVAEVPWFCRALSDARTLAADDLADDATMRSFRDACATLPAPGSALDAVVRLGGEVAGVVCMDHFDAGRRWTLDEQGFAGSIADMVAVALKSSERRVVQELNRRLASIVEASHDAIFSLSPRGSILSWNPGAERIYGYRARDVVGGPVARLFADGSVSDEFPLLARVTRGEQVEHLDTIHVHRSGRAINVSLTLSPIRNAHGRITSVAAVARDVTSRRHAEQEVERLRRRSQLILESAGDGIFGLDADGRITFVNPAAAWMLGCDPEELIGCSKSDLARARATPPVDSAAGNAEQFDLGGYRQAEDVFWRFDGSCFPVEYTSTPIQEGGRIVGAVLTFRDVTERKRAEAALIDAKEAAEAASRTKSDFLSSMSHELRTPLNSVLGFANVLRRNRSGSMQPQELQYLDRIVANGTHLLGLINDLLDLSKIEAGRAELEIAPVELSSLIPETLAALQGSIRPGVQLITRIPPAVATVQSDAAKWRQVLINLVGNALKFTERGSVTVALHTDLNTGRPLRVDVCDTGIGIPADRIGSIFQAFQQGESGTARRFGGTGLGLTITTSLCRLMRYRIEVQSEVGVGTTFSVLLDGVGEDRSGGGMADPPAAHPAVPPITS